MTTQYRNDRETERAALDKAAQAPQPKQPEMDCPFCAPYDGHDTRRLFSLGFQGLGICGGCIEAALTGFKRWRWVAGECYLCKMAAQVFKSAPHKLQGHGDVGLCVDCLTTGQGALIRGALIDERKPRKQTQAERSSGNL